ncbi:MAG: NUDIX domain-containing protein [Ruthenibacterium lactatiformans]
MLYRVGSRVVAPSWCGVGGHFEQAELNDPRACALRELREETGLTEESLEELRLRYITLRMKNGEIRQNYYFFAGLKPGAAVRGTCDEGRLEWVPYDSVLKREMPFTAKTVLRHYLRVGCRTRCIYGVSPKRRTVHLRSLRSLNRAVGLAWRMHRTSPRWGRRDRIYGDVFSLYDLRGIHQPGLADSLVGAAWFRHAARAGRTAGQCGRAFNDRGGRQWWWPAFADRMLHRLAPAV